jgi:hypothetical protein
MGLHERPAAYHNPIPDSGQSQRSNNTAIVEAFEMALVMSAYRPPNQWLE